jgi:serine/threonine protein kinase
MFNENRISRAAEHAEEEFEKEIRFMRTVRHVNIVLFFGAGSMDSRPILVTEFCSRGTLRSILANNAMDLPWGKRLKFAADAACGMRFLHHLQPPTIHRDLKSSNLLVSEGWVTKVADFGTARLFEHVCNVPGKGKSMKHTVDGLPEDRMLTKGVGTLLWTAPEVLSGLPYGQSADVYSFAIVMWEISTRRLPYENIKNSWDVARFVIEGNRPPIDGMCPTGEQCSRCSRSLLSS